MLWDVREVLLWNYECDGLRCNFFDDVFLLQLSVSWMWLGVVVLLYVCVCVCVCV